MSFKKKFFQNILISGSYTFLIQITAFVASIITSHLLLPADFGLVGLITVFSNFISVFSDSGVSYAVIRSNYTYSYHRGLNMVSILIGIALCFFFLLLIYPLSTFYKNEDLILPGIAISFLFIFRSINIVPVAVFQKKLEFGFAGRAVFFGSLLGSISTIIMAYYGLKYWSLIWSQYIAALTTSIILYNRSGLQNFHASKRLTIKSFNLARTLLGSLIGFNMVNYWARNADNLIVGKYYGTNDLGIYNRAYLMLWLPLTLIAGIFSSVLYPSLIKYKKEGGDVEKEYYFMLKIISLINIPIAIVLILFPQFFVELLWGKNWLALTELLPYFGLLVMTQTLTSTLGSVMIMENKEKYMMYAGWIGGAFMVAGIIFGSTISLKAIAAFYALSYLALVLPFYIFFIVKKKLNYNYSLWRFWIPKFVLSIIIWIGIYNALPFLLIPALCTWIFAVLFEARSELKKVLSIVFKKDQKLFS